VASALRRVIVLLHMAAPAVSLVIPAYNEERRLPRLLDVLEREAARDLAAAGLELAEAVLVDDGSIDASPELVRERAGAISLLRPLLRPGPNRGKGAAVAAGVMEARGEVVLVTDVDLSTPLVEAGVLLEAIQAGADLAIGSRGVDRSRVERSARRNLMGRGYNLLVRALTRLPYRDTQCGFKLLTAPAARALLERQISERYAFDVEMLIRARSLGMRVAEVSVSWEEQGDSRISAWTTAPVLAWDTLVLTWRLRRLPRQPTAPVAGAAGSAR
jgi:dolichyl-phosphate beta-glucosyltransferase